jgi:hypothetical protein
MIGAETAADAFGYATKHSSEFLLPRPPVFCSIGQLNVRGSGRFQRGDIATIRHVDKARDGIIATFRRRHVCRRKFAQFLAAVSRGIIPNDRHRRAAEAE